MCQNVGALFYFNLTRGSVTALQRGDFDGVSVATGTLSLSGIGLERLSSGVFEGIGVIRFLAQEQRKKAKGKKGDIPRWNKAPTDEEYVCLCICELHGSKQAQCVVSGLHTQCSS